MKFEKNRMNTVRGIAFCFALLSFGQTTYADELGAIGITIGDGMTSVRIGVEDSARDGSFSSGFLSFSSRDLDYDGNVGSQENDYTYRSYALRLDLENGSYFGPNDRFFVSVEYGGGIALSERPDPYDDYETVDLVGKIAFNLGAVILSGDNATINGGVGCARLATLVGEDNFDDATDTCYFRIENRWK